MSTKAQRGTKRTCQNAECGSRFYDLGRDPIVCPICSSKYLPEAEPAAVVAAAAERRAARPAPKKPVYAPDPEKVEDAPEAVATEALEDVETEDTEAAAGDDETFLEEEEEDGSDMSGIIGGPVAEPEEPDR